MMSTGGKACSEGHCVPFCNSGIEDPVRESPSELFQSCPFDHSRADTGNGLILEGHTYDLLAEYRRPGLASLCIGELSGIRI